MVESSLKTSDALLGKTLFGAYKVLEVAGEGGASRVYLARQLDCRRPVAIKTLTVLKPEILKLFSQVIELNKQLDHSNIVQTIGCHTTEIGRPFLAMEYLAGVTLADVLTSVSRFEREEDIALLLLQVLDAVEYAHSVNVIHGDLKPGNIMLVEKNGNLAMKILDFGLAVVKPEIEKLTGTRLTSSSYGFAAPEFLLTGNFDKRSDVYSLGALAHYLSSGSCAIEPTHYQTLVRESQPLPLPVKLSSLRPELIAVEDLEQVLLRALNTACLA